MLNDSYTNFLFFHVLKNGLLMPATSVKYFFLKKLQTMYVKSRLFFKFINFSKFQQHKRVYIIQFL
jgi:hypothetical protein